MRLVPPRTRVSAGELSYRGQDLLSLTDLQYRKKILWKEISLVPQSAMASLNPVYRVGPQIAETIQAHERRNKNEIRQRIAMLFKGVGLQPELAANYPHEFSGGMRQRAMIAMSLTLEPGLIIMDEPTTGLDVLVQERILRELKAIRAKSKAAIFLITHDISVLAEMSDRIGVMYAGRIMEQAGTEELFKEPFHPYTLGLKNAFPSIQALDRELISIPGSPPNLAEDIPGCVFVFRCPFAITDCEKERPPDLEIKPNHFVHCIRTDHIDEFRERAGDKKTWQSSKLAISNSTFTSTREL
jgi:peptide/nickel transport system ATP-binding protein